MKWRDHRLPRPQRVQLPAWRAHELISSPWVLPGRRFDEIILRSLSCVRKRLRQELVTPSTEWDNEWDGVPGPEAILIGAVQNPKLLSFQGKTLAEVARIQGKDPMDALFDLLVDDNAYTQGISFGMNEQDIALALQQPWVSIDTDYAGVSPEGLLSKDHAHPRAYGTFPRILRKYVREEKKLTLEEAIRKFTALPAQRARLGDRGALKVGLWADVVIFNPDKFTDRATFERPDQLAEGIDYVLVNGVPVIDAGKMTGQLPGKALRGPAWQPAPRGGSSEVPR